MLNGVSTFRLNAQVSECKLLLNDEMLLTRLSGGYLIAGEPRYYAECHSVLYRNAERARKAKTLRKKMTSHLEVNALAELVTFIEESDEIVKSCLHFNLLTWQGSMQTTCSISVMSQLHSATKCTFIMSDSQLSCVC